MMEQHMTLEHRLTAVEDAAAAHSRRLDELERRVDDQGELVASVAALATKQERMEEDVKEIKADVKTLASLPARRWNDLTDKALWAVAAAVIAFALARLGL